MKNMKLKFLRWLLSDNEDFLINEVVGSPRFEDEVEKMAESAADDAVDEYQRTVERDGFQSSDIGDFDDAVDERIEKFADGEDFARRLDDAVTESLRDEDKVMIKSEDFDETVKRVVTEMTDVNIESLLSSISDDQLQRLKYALSQVGA